MTHSFPAHRAPPLPRPFLLKRLHSLAGLGLLLFLCEHLLTNSRAALWFSDEGRGFIHAVNQLHELPYLQILELGLIAAPLFIHTYYGIVSMLTSQPNSYVTDGSLPSLTDNPHNRNYTWQRRLSWLILIVIVAHVLHMRFIEYPQEVQIGSQRSYLIRIDEDPGLPSLALKLGFQFYSTDSLQTQISALQKQRDANPLLEKQINEWVQSASGYSLQPYQRLVEAPSFGLAELMIVRETFKSPTLMLLYSIFVLTTVFHACNGLWLGLIRWGITVTVRSQEIFYRFSLFLMTLLSFLGLVTIWGTYWITLKG